MSGHRFPGQQAVVLGASVGGLLAARVLSEHFERVVVLERDPLSGSGPRKGVPQARHTHGLLAGGLNVLEELFPAITEQLIAHGAEAGDVPDKSLWHLAGGPLVQFPSGLRGTIQSRPLLERVIRERLLTIPNVELRDQTSAERPVIDVHLQKIVGLQITDRRFVPADLVLDASGRGSRLPAWLEGLGYERPAEERVDVDLAYATQIFRRQPGDFGDLMAVIIPQAAPNKRFGVALAIEDNRWSLTIGGMFGEQPPTDQPGFREFARGLVAPQIHEFLAHAEPLSEIATYKMPGSLRRRYERLDRFPQGLLALGDALCSFNPIYGQGMTVAALEAVALGKCLSAGVENLAPRFFRAAARLIDNPWQIAVTSDFQFAETTGNKPRLAGVVNAWLRLVHQAAHRDPAVALAFHRVANLLDDPSSLMRPGIIARVLARWVAGHRRVGAAVNPGGYAGLTAPFKCSANPLC